MVVYYVVQGGIRMTNSSGLSAHEVAELTRAGKANKMPAKSSASAAAIVASNVFTYFNGIFAVLAVLLIAAGSYKNLTFLPVVIANMVIGIIQQLRAKKVLDKLALLDVSEYTAIRDGEDMRVASDALVLGDLVRIESGQQIPADAIVVSGEGSANEALLTGEADEVAKKQGDELMSGSFLVSGSLVAELTQVGADSYAAKLTAKAKEVKEKKSEMVAGIERIILVAGILIIPVGALLFWQGITTNQMTYPEATISMVAAVTGMIPEGLYLLVTIALALSAMRLAQHNVLLHDMRSIETLARVDVLCVDKTGTITSEDMGVQEVFAAAGVDDTQSSRAEQTLAAYIRTVPDNNITMEALRGHFAEVEPLVASEVTPFSSKLKYSEVRCEHVAYRLGAPEFLLTEEQLEENRDLVDERASAGMRVLAFVEDSSRGGDASEHGSARPVLFVALRNEVRPDARETFSYFANQGVRVVVISGDNPLTVSKVAEDAGIQDADKYVDAATLETPEQIKKAVNTYTVFGRVKPEQKKDLIEAFKLCRLKVAMTGDGVNDILAMKEADCSIAMGGGSDAARQAAQVVLLDSDFSHMKGIVSEGRRDINNITRSATLFLYKNIFSLSLALFSIFGAFVYPLEPNQVSLISMFNIGVPAFLLAFEPNEKKQHGHFVTEVMLRSLPAALTSFFAIAALVVFADLFDISSSDVSTASTYLLSVVGFLILIALITPPNKYRIFVLVVCIVGLIAGCGFFYRLFDIYDLSTRALVLCVVFAFAEVGVLEILRTLVRWLREQDFFADI